MASAGIDDDYAADPVPDSKRIGWPLIFFAEMGVATALFFMQITSILTLAYGSRIALIATAYATIVAALIGSGICAISIRTGFGMNLLARRVLGYRGAFLFSLIFGVNSVIYFAAEATIMGASLKTMFAWIPLWVALPAIALAMIPLVWFGMRILARLQLVTFILYAVLLAASLYISLQLPGHGGDWLHFRPAAAPAWGVSLFAAIGTMNSVIFTSGLLTADYARFVRRSQIRVGTLFVGVGFQAFCYAFSGLLGVWFSTLYRDTNPGAYFVTMLAGWGTVFAIATQLRINLSNMYSGSIAFLNIFRQLADIEVSRHLMVLVFGIGTAIAMMFDLLSNLTTALGVIGMFVTCFTCLVLVDVFVLRPVARDAPACTDEPGRSDWHWPAIAALVSATALGCVLQTGLFGTVWVSMAGLAAALFQSVLYGLISRSRAVPHAAVRIQAQS